MGAAAVARGSSLDELAQWGLHFLCVWLVGLVLGWLLPKPKWVERGLRAKALLVSSPPGLWVRRGLLAAHAAVIVREVWRNLFAPGTFRGALRAAWRTATTGARFEWPRPAAAPSAGPTAASAPADCWYVGEKELAEFKWVVDQGGRPAGAGDWELLMERQWPGCTYTAWRRSLASGKSEYKSVTVSEDATAEEFMDFYLDEDARTGWDSLISETQLLESGREPGGRRQVVRWLRTFPFSFISQREYVIARAFFRDAADGALYAVTRGLPAHPAAPAVPGRVRMEGFHSHWRSRTVPCPRGSGRPAVETTLLHFEDFRINERLARFAVRHGMAGFVKGMIPAVRRFVDERRARCDPNAEDPASFGRRLLAVPALPGAPPAGLERTSSQLSSAASQLSTAASCASECGGSVEDSASEQGGLPRSSSMRRLGAMMLASGVAIALARTASSPSLAAPAPQSSGPGRGGKRLHHGGRHHGHAHRAQHGGHGRRHDGGARQRRRQLEPEPAAVAAMLQS